MLEHLLNYVYCEQVLRILFKICSIKVYIFHHIIFEIVLDDDITSKMLKFANETKVNKQLKVM